MMTVYLDTGLGFDQLGHGAVVGAVHVLYHPEQRLLPWHPVVYPRLLLLHVCDRFCDDRMKQLSFHFLTPFSHKSKDSSIIKTNLSKMGHIISKKFKI